LKHLSGTVLRRRTPNATYVVNTFHHWKPDSSLSRKVTKPSRSVPNRLALDIRPERRLHSTAFREFTNRIFVPSNRTASLPHPPSSECDASRKSRGMGRLRTWRSAASGVTAMRLQKVWERPTRKRLLDQLTHFSKIDGNS
jgi:hypothetical protein